MDFDLLLPKRRIRFDNPRVVDGFLAALLTAGAIADAALQPHRALNAVVIVALILLTGSVAWRHVNPFLTTLIAITGLIVFHQASGYAGDGAFELAAIALNFYLLGCRTRRRRSVILSLIVFACWFVAAAVISHSTASGSVSSVLSIGVLFGCLPFAVGRTLTTRSALTRELETTTERLRDEQEARAHFAACEERNRIARELHDVIAHSISVMVIQTGGARRVASGNLEKARGALRVVETSGREALVELRLIVGVLRRDHDELAGSAIPGLSQLDALVDRTRAVGLPVELRLEGEARSLSPGLDLIAYRVVQEALTNVIKHSGPASVEVTVTFGICQLELRVADTGHGSAPKPDGTGTGLGLVGMGERVALYGGELTALACPGGGFEVRARIPYDGIGSSLHVSPALAKRDDQTATAVARAARVHWPWLDPLLAGVLLAVLEIGVLTSGHLRGPLVLNMTAVAVMATAAIWRRRSPLLILIIFGAIAAIMNNHLTSLNSSPLIGPVVLLIPIYSVAAWEHRRKAIIGLAIFLSGTAAATLIVRHGGAGDFVGAAFAITAAWASGRAIRARRQLVSDLKLMSSRLAAEREDRARLVVAGERTRIGRELHAVVAQRVAAMIIQAEAARSLLDLDPLRADAAMSATEDNGRQVLIEMRRMLGVLRRVNDVGELQPQPGLDQIYALIQRERERGQPIELSVLGEPGTLPAGVDLGTYRIVEEALQSVRQQSAGLVGVTLRFSEESLELHLIARCHGPSHWPTDAMEERVAICGGELHTDRNDTDNWEVVAHMPRGLHGVLA